MGLNKRVDFSTAKLLKEKGFDEKCSHYYIDDFQNFKHDGKLYKTSLPDDWDNENIFQYVKRTNQFHLCNAPTIAEVIMWLYEKHKIWIIVTPKPYSDTITYWRWEYKPTRFYERNACFIRYKDYNSPTEAYLNAIEYVLNKLI